jgi:hypothetical protein
MTLMNLSHSFKLLLVVSLAVSLVAAPAAAVSVAEDGVPQEAEVGSEVTATFTLTELYKDSSNEWTLAGETELENVSWTVKKFGLDDSQLDKESFGGSEFTADVAADDDVTRVEVTVTGTVPAVENFTYSPEETFQLASLSRQQGDNTEELESWDVHHYTKDSKEARQAIAAAESAIEQAGGDEDAEKQVTRAISSYNNGNFENAADIAADAEESASSTKQSNERNELLLYGGIGAVALLAVVGGVFYWRSQQDTYDKLR